MAWTRIRVTERQVLILLLGASMVAYGATIIWSSLFFSKGRPLAPGGEARVRWMRPGVPETHRDFHWLLAEYFDPSLMSLPSPHGFSQTPWQHRAQARPAPYEPPQVAAFLPAASGIQMPELLPPLPLTTAVLNQLQRHTFETEFGDAFVAREPVTLPTNSVIQVAGALAQRAVTHWPALPLAPLEPAARWTRVLIAVAADGVVHQAVLERTSGNEALDTQALDAARQLRFEPEANRDPLALMWGTVRFVWASPASRN